jgi:hypothetical protein
MNQLRIFLVLTICALACTATAYGQSAQPVVKLPNEVEFKAPVSPAPTQNAVLYGDPAKPGV